MSVFNCIADVMGALSRDGVGKSRQAPKEMGGYEFRGIDDVLNALSDKLAHFGLVIWPNVLERQVSETVSKNGQPLQRVVVRVKYTLACVKDGTMTEAVVYGEALDGGDKATNKAMSAAYKYMAFQVFCIPTIGIDSESDADAVAGKRGNGVAHVRDESPAPGPTKQPKLAKPGSVAELDAPKPTSPDVDKGESDRLEKQIGQMIAEAKDADDAAAIDKMARNVKDKLTTDARDRLRGAFKGMVAKFAAESQP